MAGILGILNSQSENSSGFKLSGFMNGNAIGHSSQDNTDTTGNSGLMQAVGLSLNKRFGLNLNTQNSSVNTLADSLKNLRQSTEAQKTEEARKKEEEKKKDRLETSGEDQTTSSSALQQALKNGTTQQIVVSEDGRFEASIDMKLNADGSYSLDMSIHFANARAAMLASQGTATTDTATQTGGAETQAASEDTGTDTTNTTDTGDDTDTESDPASLAYQGASALYQRYTSYEQTLQARGFEANIFFEEAKSVAASAEQAYGSGTGDRYMSVAGEVAQEYTLNISISGDDLSNFNAVAEELTQFDDSGTLTGFLQAAQSVLTSDSSNLGAFVDATQSLVSATQEHVSAKLTNFFSSMQDQFGGTLEEMGFEPNYLENLGQDVQSDLNTFFQVTNDFFENLFNNGEIEDTTDPDTQIIESLDEQLTQLEEKRQEVTEKSEDTTDPGAQILDSVNEEVSPIEEKRQELIGEPLPPKPEHEPIFKNELPPKMNRELIEKYDNTNTGKQEKGILEAVA